MPPFVVSNSSRPSTFSIGDAAVVRAAGRGSSCAARGSRSSPTTMNASASTARRHESRHRSRCESGRRCPSRRSASRPAPESSQMTRMSFRSEPMMSMPPFSRPSTRSCDRAGMVCSRTSQNWSRSRSPEKRPRRQSSSHRCASRDCARPDWRWPLREAARSDVHGEFIRVQW